MSATLFLINIEELLKALGAFFVFQEKEFKNPQKLFKGQNCDERLGSDNKERIAASGEGIEKGEESCAPDELGPQISYELIVTVLVFQGSLY